MITPDHHGTHSDGATGTLERIWQDIPTGTPPVADMINSGRQRLRRRRQALAAALTLAVLAGATASANLLDHDSRTLATATAIPTAPPGHHLVGVGDAVVTVPNTWATNAYDGCGLPATDTILLPGPPPIVGNACAPVYRRPGTVKFASLHSRVGKQAAEWARTGGTVDGVDVLYGSTGYCPVNTSNPAVACPAIGGPDYVVVPSRDLVIVYDQEGPRGQQASDIVDSLQFLPAGWTTVPSPDLHRRAIWGDIFIKAHVTPVYRSESDCEVGFCAKTERRTVLDPPAGTVVRYGAKVTVTKTP